MKCHVERSYTSVRRFDALRILIFFGSQDRICSVPTGSGVYGLCPGIKSGTFNV
jgi:hypothetical protein